MVNKAKSLSHIGKRSVLLSVIALFEIAALVVVSCFSWIEHGPAELDADEFVIMSGSGFNFFNEDGDAVDVLQIKAGGQLSDCSTIDGRRLYFPVLGNADGSTAAKAVDGSKLMYRAATEVDQNYYITVDFQVISISDKPIDVFIDPRSSYIRYKDNSTNVTQPLTAARVTFNSNDGTKPITVCPGDVDKTNKYLVPDQKTGEAKPSEGTTTYKAMNKGVKFNDNENKYEYDSSHPTESDNPKVFTLPANKVKTITMTVWLDGFDETCTDSIVNVKNTKLQIRFGVRDVPNSGS